MKLLKHILMVVALLATLLPCSHAAIHHGHGHDHGTAMELCALGASPCACHSCDHQPCSDRLEIQRRPAPVSDTIEPPAALVLFLSFPETKPAIKKTTPPVSGILAALQTVQLLI
jgi:hypothetical protein